MTTPSGHATARRNLAFCVEQFLWAHEGMPTLTLTRWQAAQGAEGDHMPEG